MLSAGDSVMGVTDMTHECRLVGHVAIIPRLHKPTIFSMDLIKLEPKSIPKYFCIQPCNMVASADELPP